MCGRFAQGLFEEWSDAPVKLEVPQGFKRRFNIAPSEEALVRLADTSTLVPMRWGLVPSWADDPAFGNKTFNARIETAAQKPTFREAFRKRRCVVPIDGFYEWQGAKGNRVPHLVRSTHGPMLLAGLWEQAGATRTFSVLTMEPNAFVAKLHDRMPVALDAKSLALWLATDTLKSDSIEEIQACAKKISMTEHAVEPLHGDSPACMQPAAQMLLFDT